ncbi:MAG: imidazoleglycerol-phosphate dehydratase HisB [Bacteroidia bacterium]
MERYLFIDRDGTLIVEPPDTQQIDSCERLKLLPRVISVLRWAQQVGGYQLVMITNQDGLGSESFPEERFWTIQRLLMDIFAAEGISWYGLHIDRSRSETPSFYRKPSPLLLLPYVEKGIDRERSFVIGDRLTDMLLAQRLGLRGIWMANPIHSQEPLPFAYIVKSWPEIQGLLRRRVFSIRLSRKTKETSVELFLSLYGEGQTSIQTGIGFFDHMLTLLAFHAGWDLELRAEGDLWVDPHHTVEDVAITLGQALYQLLRDKRGIHRYGQSVDAARWLPMDEAISVVAIDISGRGLATWQLPLTESLGGITPTLWKHFFETLAREAAITLHIQSRGEDAHHIVEAVFKGVGRALREALHREGEAALVPSTKGSL